MMTAKTKIKMEKITIQQALQQGYTHYNVYQEEESGKLDHLVENGVYDYNKGKKVVLMSKTTITFNISADTIQQLLTDHISGQEEFAMEDDTLYDELDVADFDKIAELANVGFKTGFIFPTDIELILDGEVQSKKFYRVGTLDGGGMWYHPDGTPHGLIHTDQFKNLQCHKLPMPFDPTIVGFLSVTESLDSLKNWFNDDDMKILSPLGYRILEYEATDYHERDGHWIINQSSSKIIKEFTND